MREHNLYIQLDEGSDRILLPKQVDLSDKDNWHVCLSSAYIYAKAEDCEIIHIELEELQPKFPIISGNKTLAVLHSPAGICNFSTKRENYIKISNHILHKLCFTLKNETGDKIKLKHPGFLCLK